MALPDYSEITQGTAIVWGEAGASGVTHTLSLNNLGSGTARMGASADLGVNFAEEYWVYLWVETGTAPADGTSVELYLASSHDGTNWPGGVTGSDAVYTLGTSDINLRRLGWPAVVLIAANVSNTVLRQRPVSWRPTGRYVAPVVDNNLAQNFRNEGTATDNDSRVILVPRRNILND